MTSSPWSCIIVAVGEGLVSHMAAILEHYHIVSNSSRNGLRILSCPCRSITHSWYVFLQSITVQPRRSIKQQNLTEAPASLVLKIAQQCAVSCDPMVLAVAGALLPELYRERRSRRRRCLQLSQMSYTSHVTLRGALQ